MKKNDYGEIECNLTKCAGLMYRFPLGTKFFTGDYICDTCMTKQHTLFQIE